jgi:hypothetical protein
VGGKRTTAMLVEAPDMGGLSEYIRNALKERSTNMKKLVEPGRGGAWDSRANPFLSKDKQHIAPSFTDVTDLARLLDALCRSGCACMVGHTRDGGAVVLTVLDGDNRHRTYAANIDELQAAIDSALAAYSLD